VVDSILKRVGTHSRSLAFLRAEAGLKLHLRLQFQPKDFWIGIRLRERETWRTGSVSIILIPMFQLLIDWEVQELSTLMD